MHIKQLFGDEDAVSPVIGVILMVAITVILAAVIGTFVLGLGDQVQSSAPTANFQFEYTDEVINEGNTPEIDTVAVTVTHNGGQDVDPENVNILVDGNDGFDVTGANDATGEALYQGVSTISTGTSAQAWIYRKDETTTVDGANVLDDSNPDDLITNVDEILGGEEVRVVWTSPNGDSSNTIGSGTVPN